MPFKAARNKSKSVIVTADKCFPSDKGKTFFCPTKGCCAEMSIVHAGDAENAFFRRKPLSGRHISANCVRCNLEFNEQKYDETQFNSDRLFSYILSKPGASVHRADTGVKTEKIGGRTPVKTLKIFYELVCKKGIESTYNGIIIGDLMAGHLNYPNYKEHLLGVHVVEVSYYKKVYGENKILFNYPCDWKDEHILLQINFENEDICFDYAKIFKAYSHTDPLVLCGDWRNSYEETTIKDGTKAKIFYECNYISSRQIYDPNWSIGFIYTKIANFHT